MIHQRLIGVVTVKDGWAVQSFGYQRYLPLGHPEVLVENLDRWGADEILLQCIDRSSGAHGPDLDLLERVGKRGLSTPLIYAGGVHTAEQAIAAVKAGADRICIDALLHDTPSLARTLAEPLGAQAVIAALPLSQGSTGLQWLDYRSGVQKPLSPEVLGLLDEGVISEALVIDWQHEGHPNSFDHGLLAQLPLHKAPLIAFGGLSQAPQIRHALQMPRVVAVAIGNFLNYREHAVQQYRQQLADLPLRPAIYERSFF